MKFARFEVFGQMHYGQVIGDSIHVIKGDIFNEYELLEEKYVISDVKLLAPVMPGKVIGVGLNFFAHIGEYHKNPKIPEDPVIFMVSPSSIIGPDEAIEIPHPDHETHHEAELTIVVGKTCKEVTVEEAPQYIFGYTCGNDVSDRDLQKQDRQWSRAKSYHTFKPIGPYIETELDPDNVLVKSRVNGEKRQDGNTKDMIRKANELVSFISTVMTLEPGDIIMTGTPEGVGPIVSGDICEIEVSGIGVLRNPVK